MRLTLSITDDAGNVICTEGRRLEPFTANGKDKTVSSAELQLTAIALARMVHFNMCLFGWTSVLDYTSGETTGL